MYDRASRVLTLPSASTTPSIGPGTYGFKSGTDKTNAGKNLAFIAVGSWKIIILHIKKCAVFGCLYTRNYCITEEL